MASTRTAHEAAALDDRGALLGAETFKTTFAGYAGLLDWLRGFGRVDVVAIESTGAYAAGLDGRHARDPGAVFALRARFSRDRRGSNRGPIDVNNFGVLDSPAVIARRADER